MSSRYIHSVRQGEIMLYSRVSPESSSVIQQRESRRIRSKLGQGMCPGLRGSSPGPQSVRGMYELP